jgi:hypothetical protein
MSSPSSSSSPPSKWLLRKIVTEISPTTSRVSLEELEQFLTSRLKVDGDCREVEYKIRHDAHWLKCGTMAPCYSITSIFGIPEDNDGGDTMSLQKEQSLREPIGIASELSIDLTFYEALALDSDNPSVEQLHDDVNENSIVSDSPFVNMTKFVPGPHSEWIRRDLGQNTTKDIRVNSSSALWWIDLRPIQHQQLVKNGSKTSLTHVNNLSSQEELLCMLRNILTPSHDVSPWVMNSGTSDCSSSQAGESREKKRLSHGRPDLVVFVMSADHPSTNLMEEIRVSDIAPSWFLHARAKLEHIEPPEDISRAVVDKKAGLVNLDSSLMGNLGSSFKENSPATMLMYKKLGPRPNLLTQQPVVDGDILKEWDVHRGALPMEGCLWEAHVKKRHDKDEESPNCISSNDEQMPASPCYRLVCPPYLNLHQEYRNSRVAELLSPKSIDVFTKDALSIPHWTPWPESVHYKVNSSNGETTMPWTVFPLCYCFPANQPQNLTWVSTTRSYVPKTCALLEEVLGPLYIRTALFSQLAPNSVLEAHTGWADLANHVLRLHIPLVVPMEHLGLCGTWVDGCVETHAVGRPLLFDDSKIHRAFNYSNDARIVLIVDLARPDHLPSGYAEGSHTDELDAFIQQMSLPK